MTTTPKRSQREVLPYLFRLLALTLIFIATPSIAHADPLTKMGLESVATSIGFLVAAIAFAGLVIAIAIYQATKSRRQE